MSLESSSPLSVHARMEQPALPIQHLNSPRSSTVTIEEDGDGTPLTSPVGAPESISLPITPAQKATFSKWGLGWTTIFLMTFFYLLAFIVAVVHLALFQYLDNKLADSQIHGISQTYITTASNLLAYAFSTTIKISLAVAFTQQLWRIMRQSAMKVSTIEVLFNIRSNPLQLFHIRAIQKTWVLFALAIILYLIPIATSFPPGAITVTSTSPRSNTMAPVLTFNGSYVGNGTIADALWKSIDPWGYHPVPTGNSTFIATLLSSVGVSFISSLQRLTTQIIVTGEPLAIPSPCGPNCSYTIQFEGPIFQCYTTKSNTQVTNTSSFAEEADWDQEALLVDLDLEGARNATSINTVEQQLWKAPPVFYSGSWNYPGGIPALMPSNTSNSGPQALYTEASFDITTLNSTDFTQPPVIVTETNLSCIPSRALYTVENSYTNNVQHLEYSTGPPTQLSNTRRQPSVNGTYYFPLGAGFADYDLQADWNPDSLEWYRDCQLMALIQQVAFVLNGSFESETLYAITNGTITPLGAQNGGYYSAANFVMNSRFNSEFQNFHQNQNTGFISDGTLNVTEDALNKMIGDLTISAMVAYDLWWETTNVTKFPSENVYTFSKPVNLLAPYFLTLGLTLPFIFVGIYALYDNGVPAADGGFIQILSTTTGSPILQTAGAGNCLGGEEISKELRDLEIQFGELVENQVNSGGKLIRRAGFGTKGEVGPLLKGEAYGSA